MKSFNLIFLFFFSFLLFNANSQRLFSSVKKISNGRGTFWGNFGYNRNYFSKSDITFKGAGYDFVVKNANSSDKQSETFSDFLSVNTPNSPQYNLRLGYYIRNKYSISFGLDHFKYIFNNGNNILLDGNIDKGVDSVWAGVYKNQTTITNSNDFHFENRMNYVSFGLMRTEKLAQTKNKLFAVSANFGIGLGGILSSYDFNFEKNYTKKIISISGFAISLQGSIRLEFYKNFFIQGELSGVSAYQSVIKTRKDDLNAISKHHLIYGQRAITAGFLIYFKPINACSDCPIW